MFKYIKVLLNHFNVKHYLFIIFHFLFVFSRELSSFYSHIHYFMRIGRKINMKEIEFNAKTTRFDEYRNENICWNEYRKYGRDDANAQAGIVTMTFDVVENFQKHGDQRWRIIRTYIIRSRAGSTNIPAAIPPVLILSLSVSLRLPPYYPPSLILLGPADGFPHAHVPRGRPGEIMNETRTGKERRDRMCFTSVIFSFPLGAGTSARAHARAITSIIKGVGCTENFIIIANSFVIIRNHDWRYFNRA